MLLFAYNGIPLGVARLSRKAIAQGFPDLAGSGTNAGLPGALALLATLVIAVRLGWDMLRSPRRGLWYGLGAGTLLACLLSALVGLVESEQAGIPLRGMKAYFYVVSPVPWILLSLLVVSHRLLRQDNAGERGL